MRLLGAVVCMGIGATRKTCWQRFRQKIRCITSVTISGNQLPTIFTLIPGILAQHFVVSLLSAVTFLGASLTLKPLLNKVCTYADKVQLRESPYVFACHADSLNPKCSEKYPIIAQLLSKHMRAAHLLGGPVRVCRAW